MNPYDRSQLNYIMSLTDEAFQEWAMSVSLDDIEYAMELIKTARTESMLKEQELLDQLEESDLSEANAVLKKFRL